ncbi:MAG: response regulator transcription factor [Acidimicrobiia bacterium]|nr:response regulator transcription factor [Acidimicrobiia bacterium]
MLNLLIIEDEPAYIDALEVSLSREGHQLAAAIDGKEGLEQFRTEQPDLVLLDLMLPGMSGLDVLRKIRSDSDVPVIVLSAKDSESDIVTALELGADDYLTKPYSVRELMARIRVAMRRSASEGDDSALTVGNAVLDQGRYQLRLDGTTFDLPRKEFELMQHLMGRPGRVVTRDHLLLEIWGYSWGDSKTLDQHIRRLRRKLEQVDGSPTITTIRGVGYRLDS